LLSWKLRLERVTTWRWQHERVVVDHALTPAQVQRSTQLQISS